MLWTKVVRRKMKLAKTAKLMERIINQQMKQAVILDPTESKTTTAVEE